MKKVDLGRYSNSWYKRETVLRRVLWYFTSSIFFSFFPPWPSTLKVFFLRAFGAKVGRGAVIKPNVNIKYPWLLEMGDNVWLGEGIWIDNLGKVKIGNNVCISQGASIFTGNHDYKKETFDLLINDVTIEDGVWVGAKAIVCPGAVLKTHSVVSVGSVVTCATEEFTIYQGIPAQEIRKRIME